MTWPPRAARRLVVVGVAVLVTACGSTVQPSQPGDPAATTQDADGLPQVSDAQGMTVGGADGMTAGGGVGTAAGAAPPPGGQPAGPAGGPGAAPPAPADPAPGAEPGAGPAGPQAPGTAPPAAAPQSGRGFTTEEIRIGYATAKAADDALSGFGFALTTGDQEGQVRAIVEDLNQRGGVAGRRVVPVLYDLPASSLTNPAAAAEAACTHWTQDNDVFAVINVWAMGGGDDTLNGCLANRETPLISMSPQLRPGSSYTDLAPHLVAPANVTMERFVPAWLGRAAALGYFDGWNTATGQPGSAPTVVGILVSGATHGSSFDALVRDELARLGQSAGPTFEYSGAIASNSSEMNSAALQFRSAGVTHVVTSAGMEPFAQAAENQGYRPRYVLSSFHNPAFAQTLVPSQLRGAVGAGLTPALDVDSANDPGDVSPAQTRCREVMESAGHDTSARQAFSLMVTACDGFNFLAAAVAAGDLSPQGMAAGAAAMGQLSPASTFAISFPGGRYDGASALRDLRFDGACQCFTYVDPTNHPM